jgi:hypothetical protein
VAGAVEVRALGRSYLRHFLRAMAARPLFFRFLHFRLLDPGESFEPVPAAVEA